MSQQPWQPPDRRPQQSGQNAHWDYAQRPNQQQSFEQPPYHAPEAAPPDPDGFFTPAYPQRAQPRPIPQSALGSVPPPYQGPVYQGPPQGEAPPPPPAGFEPPDDRMIFGPAACHNA